MAGPIRDATTPGVSAGWSRAIGEHDAAVAAFVSAASAVPDASWNHPHAPGNWTPAEEVLHVALSYEVALRGVRTGAGMRARVSPGRARLLRWLVLPVMLESNWFPRAKAPVEIRPPKPGESGDVDLSRTALLARIAAGARAVRDEFPASRPDMRFHHAYFGDLAPRQGMRMLAAHTRHHARGMARRFRNLTE